MNSEWKFDVFISHASEDKEAVARPMATALIKQGLRVFYDEVVLTLGDPIRSSLDRGLTESQFGVVIISPEFLKKDWTRMELGALFALEIPGRKVILPILHNITIEELKQKSPMLMDKLSVSTKAGLHVVIREILRVFQIPSHSQTGLSRNPSQPNSSSVTVESVAYDALYHFETGYVKAIRLFGADSEYIPEARLELHYTHEFLQLEPPLELIRQEYTNKQSLQSNLHSWNGPNTRVISFDAGTINDDWTALEQKTLRLILGPVGWWDYKALNLHFFNEKIGNVKAPVADYDYYTGLHHILEEQDISRSRLSNISSTAATILTKDGFLAYIQRSNRASKPGLFTSAVAENINRYWDDANPNDSYDLVNASEARHGEDKNASYKPKRTPHPFATVRRGVNEELSPALSSAIQPGSLRLIGLCFDLIDGHPDILFLLPLPLSRDEVEYICRVHPPKDKNERKGQIHFTRADFKDHDTLTALQDSSKWIPSGQASVVRSLEYIRAKAAGRNLDKAIESLCDNSST